MTSSKNFKVLEYNTITSPANPKIKECVKLREGRYRRKSGRILIDGGREIDRALRGGVIVTDLFGLDSHRETLLEIAARSRTISGREPVVAIVAEPVFEKISFGNRQTEIVAVAEAPRRLPEHFCASVTSSSPLLAVLEGVEKPGNVGAVFRSADGAGLDGILLADPLSDLDNPNCIRASLGTVFRLPATVLGAEAILDWLRSRNIRPAVARCDGAIPYTHYDFREPTAIVLGSEAKGLTDLWRGPDVTPIVLPMAGVADSLNVSVAAAILFYEARRQRDES